MSAALTKRKKTTVTEPAAASVAAPYDGIADISFTTAEVTLQLPDNWRGHYVRLGVRGADCYVCFLPDSTTVLAGLDGGADAGIAAGVGTETVAVPEVVKDGEIRDFVVPLFETVFMRYRTVSGTASIRIRAS
jgi:hypothetical protein